MPAEAPRSLLFRNRAKRFKSLAGDRLESRPGYLELAVAYEQLANAAERGEAMRAATEQAATKPARD